ncbi:MAG: ABC transporter permease [Schleiferiaceae bacterium]|nr:ABC transporter permease [Schleiferiaceae bacterium]MDP4859454.1 ABC transporter permease [Schleiferiaceae bacterium]
MMRIRPFIEESLGFAYHSLVSNRLRTFLSVLGIAVGIFAIISVYALVDSLERSIRNSVQGLGSDIVYVQKWPWGGGGGEYPWWKYFQRPETEYREYVQLAQRMERTSGIAAVMGLRPTLEAGSNSVENAQMRGVTEHYATLWKLKLEQGRAFSTTEARSGRPVCVLGASIAEGLFPTSVAVGKSLSSLGRTFTVIGLLEREGASLIGESHDEQVLVPAAYLRTLVDERNSGGSNIMVQAAPGQTISELKSEIRGYMRSIRKLKPQAEDNFALNESSSLSAGLDQMFGIIGLAGTIIGGFSVLVGGFGIANIMFVSVRERTGQIGIQKALGARKSFVLAQFLVESVLLSLIGGLIGLMGVGLLVLAARHFTEFDVAMTWLNALQGLGISAVIGLLAGVVPAYIGARLDPVEAIRVNT